jgi:hypothetical protein
LIKAKAILSIVMIKLPPLPQTKAGRIKLAAGALGGILLFIWVIWFLGGPSEPPPMPQQPAAPEEKPVPPAPPNADNSKIILELFSPSDQSLNHQLTTTSLSQQIEQTMTITFVLVKCQIISQDDYSDIFRALILYAQGTKLAPDAASAEAKVRQIAESSSASYALVYNRASCTDSKLPPLANDITKWSRQVLKQQ